MECRVESNHLLINEKDAGLDVCGIPPPFRPPPPGHLGVKGTRRGVAKPWKRVRLTIAKTV